MKIMTNCNRQFKLLEGSRGKSLEMQARRDGMKWEGMSATRTFLIERPSKIVLRDSKYIMRSLPPLLVNCSPREDQGIVAITLQFETPATGGMILEENNCEVIFQTTDSRTLIGFIMRTKPNWELGVIPHHQVVKTPLPWQGEQIISANWRIKEQGFSQIPERVGEIFH